MLTDDEIMRNFFKTLITVINCKNDVLNNENTLNLIKPLKKSILRIHNNLDDEEANIFSLTLFCTLFNTVKTKENTVELLTYNIDSIDDSEFITYQINDNSNNIIL